LFGAMTGIAAAGGWSSAFTALKYEAEVAHADESQKN